MDDYGIYVQPINYPTVRARHRTPAANPVPICIRMTDIDHLMSAFSEIFSACGLKRQVA